MYRKQENCVSSLISILDTTTETRISSNMCPIIGNTTCSLINDSTVEYEELTGNFKQNTSDDKEQVITSTNTYCTSEVISCAIFSHFLSIQVLKA